MNSHIRYLVFACEDYYPAGGWGDFVSAHEELADALKAEAQAEMGGKSAHTVDLETLTRVPDAVYRAVKAGR